jgi:hypothetical protein
VIALLGLILVIAIAVALAPIILGVIGTMLALLLTAILYMAAGCPATHASKPSAADQAEQDETMRQLDAWDVQDKARRAHGKR